MPANLDSKRLLLNPNSPRTDATGTFDKAKAIQEQTPVLKFSKKQRESSGRAKSSSKSKKSADMMSHEDVETNPRRQEFKRPVPAVPQIGAKQISGFESEVLAERWAKRVNSSGKVTEQTDNPSFQQAVERASKGAKVPKGEPADQLVPILKEFPASSPYNSKGQAKPRTNSRPLDTDQSEKTEVMELDFHPKMNRKPSTTRTLDDSGTKKHKISTRP